MIPSALLTLRGARVWDGARSLGVIDAVTVRGGVFETLGTTSAPASAESIEIDCSGLWLVPGIVDAHAHVAWNDFDQADREARSAEEHERDTARTLHAMLAAGVTAARDAGGAARPVQDAQRTGATPGPRLQLSVDLLDREHVDAAGGIGVAVVQALAAGATWIKLIATGGVASPAGSQLQSHFSPAEFALATRLAAEAGARVMVHAWGGEAITDALEAGAASIEHGIFLTEDQAALGAERGAVLVPTLRIYRLVQGLIEAGRLPAAFGPRVDEAVQVHPAAVLRARDAGMQIALGSDYAAPEQHGTNLAEIAELRRAGLDAEEALTAATRTGARLLAPPDASADRVRLSGRIAPGAAADAVLLSADPASPDAFLDPAVVAAVIQDGRLAHTRDASATGRPGIRMTSSSPRTADSRRPHDRSTL